MGTGRQKEDQLESRAAIHRGVMVTWARAMEVEMNGK